MKVLWNNQECPVIEETANLYAIETVFTWKHLLEGPKERVTKQIVWVRKDWVEPVEEV